MMTARMMMGGHSKKSNVPLSERNSCTPEGQAMIDTLTAWSPAICLCMGSIFFVIGGVLTGLAFSEDSAYNNKIAGPVILVIAAIFILICIGIMMRRRKEYIDDIEPGIETPPQTINNSKRKQNLNDATSKSNDTEMSSRASAPLNGTHRIDVAQTSFTSTSVQPSTAYAGHLQLSRTNDISTAASGGTSLTIGSKSEQIDSDSSGSDSETDSSSDSDSSDSSESDSSEGPNNDCQSNITKITHPGSAGRSSSKNSSRNSAKSVKETLTPVLTENKDI